MLRIDVLHNSNDFESHELQTLRSTMLVAFKEAGLPPHWHEWSINDASLPYYLRGFDPNSIFINGTRVKAVKNKETISTEGMQVCATCIPSKKTLNDIIVARYGWPKLRMNWGPKIISFVFVLPFLILMLLPTSLCGNCWIGYNDGSIEILRQFDFSKANFVYIQPYC